MSESKGNSGGIGFMGMLGILFIGLKLAGFIDWPWVWVLAPIWSGFALVLALVVIYVVADMMGKRG